MLTLENARITQGDFSLTASLTVAKSARIAVMGPSGAGKSTLLSAIAGFIPLSAGSITVDGSKIDDKPPAARPLSMVFQDGNLFPHMTAFQNVALGIRPTLRLRKGDEAQVNEALEGVGLGRFGDRKPAALSGGQQSRVALARVLLRRNPLLLLDEPFAALGPALKQEMLGLVDDLATKRGLTVLMVTHDPRDAEYFASDVIVVANGAAHPPQEIHALMADPPPDLKDYLGT